MADDMVVIRPDVRGNLGTVTVMKDGGFDAGKLDDVKKAVATRAEFRHALYHEVRPHAYGHMLTGRAGTGCCAPWFRASVNSCASPVVLRSPRLKPDRGFSPLFLSAGEKLSV